MRYNTAFWPASSDFPRLQDLSAICWRTYRVKRSLLINIDDIIGRITSKNNETYRNLHACIPCAKDSSIQDRPVTTPCGHVQGSLRSVACLLLHVWGGFTREIVTNGFQKPCVESC